MGKKSIAKASNYFKDHSIEEIPDLKDSDLRFDLQERKQRRAESERKIMGFFDSNPDHFHQLAGVMVCRKLLGARFPPGTSQETPLDEGIVSQEAISAFYQGIDLILSNGKSVEVTVVNRPSQGKPIFNPRLGDMTADWGILCEWIGEYTIGIVGKISRLRYQQRFRAEIRRALHADAYSFCIVDGDLVGTHFLKWNDIILINPPPADARCESCHSEIDSLTPYTTSQLEEIRNRFPKWVSDRLGTVVNRRGQPVLMKRFKASRHEGATVAVWICSTCAQKRPSDWDMRF